MNIIIAHKYAHRLLNNQTIESAPAITSDAGEIHMLNGTWRQRSPEEMDLSGGDMHLIRQSLETLSFAFADDAPRLPRLHNAVQRDEPDPMGAK